MLYSTRVMSPTQHLTRLPHIFRISCSPTTPNTFCYVLVSPLHEAKCQGPAAFTEHILVLPPVIYSRSNLNALIKETIWKQDGHLENIYSIKKIYWAQQGTQRGNWKQYKQIIKLDGQSRLGTRIFMCLWVRYSVCMSAHELDGNLSASN